MIFNLTKSQKLAIKKFNRVIRKHHKDSYCKSAIVEYSKVAETLYNKGLFWGKEEKRLYYLKSYVRYKLRPEKGIKKRL